MKIGITRDQSDERVATPFIATVRKCNCSSEEREDPELAEDAMKCPFLKILAAVCQTKHGEDLQESRRNCEHVCCKSREA